MELGWSTAARRAALALGRDGLRTRSDDEQRQLDLCQIMWWMRHLVLAAAVAAELARGGAWERADALVVIALVFQVTSHTVVRVRPRAARAVTVADAALIVALAALGMPTLLVVVMSVGVLGWAATFRPLAAVAAGLVAIGAVVTSYALHADDISTETGAAAFCLLGVIFVVRTARMNMGARRASERERLVADGIDAILWETVPDGDGGLPTMRVSSAAERMLGHPLDSWAAPGFLSSIVHDDDRSGFEEHLAGRIDGSMVVRLRHADGRFRWMEHRATWITDRAARNAFAVGVLLDRTEQIEAEREALAFGHLVASSPIGQVLLRCTAAGPVVEAMNLACQRLLLVAREPVGLPLAEVAGIDVAALVQLTDPAATRSTIELQDGCGRIQQVTLRRLDQRSCSMDFLDVTERVEAGARLHAQARQDDLTGLPNRRAFIEALEGLLERAETAGNAPRPAAVVIVDLDEFKDINDSLGHETGDLLLREVGRRIVDHVGPHDLVARLGGDEFAMVLFCDPDEGGPADEGAPDVRNCSAVDLVTEINRPVLVGDLRLRVRASAGVVPFGRASGGPTGASAAELLRCADVAMYLAKEHGSGVEHYDANSDRFDRERLELLNDLESAIASDQLVLHHQPLVDVPTGRIIGTEALARWNHPVLGLVPPDSFIGLAEVSGQMKHLTRWVIRRALSDLVALGDAGADLEVSVNLSVRNLYEVDLVEWIAATLATFGVSPRRLVVEITESTVMDDQLAAIEVIQGLRDLGVRTWIDDFGTGHSSFARLRALPVDGVKIDRAFVSGATASSSDRIVLQSMIELVSALEMHTVAEGVEHRETLVLLRELGCDMAQGFALSRPLTFEALQVLLEDSSSVRPLAASSRSGR